MSAKMLGFIAVVLLCTLPAHAEKKCVLQQGGELPVTMAGTRPLISGTINGSPARFLADSGAFFSVLSRDAVEKYALKVGPMSPNFRVTGTSGSETMGLTKVAKFSLDGFGGGQVYRDVEFLVSSGRFGAETAGIIGQNVLGTADAEYDLANGVIRLFRTKDCGGAMLAYWARNMSVAEMVIEPTTPARPHLIGQAKLNGKKIRVVFDTGASSSVLTLKAAKRAGIEPESDEVAAGGISRGIGKRTNENFIARFDTLDLGGEMIRNARLRMADIRVGDAADMLLGADFFLSHRIYVSAQHRRLYFTYNGGPVFDLRGGDRTRSLTTDADDGAQADDESGASAAQSPDAAELRRRGAASAGRRDFQAAIADLESAIAMDSADAENYYQRGLAYWQSGRPRLALQDFDQTLKLEPDHVFALLSRGALHLARKDKPSAVTDFDAAMSIASNDPEIPLRVARSFQSFGEFDEAIVRYDAWQAKYPKDQRLAGVMSDRCWSRAMLDRELDSALADCDAALKKGLRNSAVYDNRAFVHLRRGDFDRSIADYDTALELQPKNAVSLYGRGLARIKKGARAEGEVDISAALELDARAGEIYVRAGLAP